MVRGAAGGGTTGISAQMSVSSDLSVSSVKRVLTRGSPSVHFSEKYGFFLKKICYFQKSCLYFTQRENSDLLKNKRYPQWKRKKQIFIFKEKE